MGRSGIASVNVSWWELRHGIDLDSRYARHGPLKPPNAQALSPLNLERSLRRQPAPSALHPPLGARWHGTPGTSADANANANTRPRKIACRKHDLV